MSFIREGDPPILRPILLAFIVAYFLSLMWG